MTKNFIGAFLVFLAVMLPSSAILAESSNTNSAIGEVQFRGCYAKWDGTGITIGNAQFERRWVLRNGHLEPASFRTKNPDVEWLVPLTNAEPAMEGQLNIQAFTGRFSPLEAESVKLDITLSNAAANKLEMRIFPGLAGVLTSPQETGEAKLNGLDNLMLAPRHLRVTQVNLVDQTDSHNELASEREWLLNPCEAPFNLSGNLIFIEDTLTGSGLAILKLAPLPAARPVKTDFDFSVNARSQVVSVAPTDYPVVILAYRAGRPGRIATLQNFQRQLRVPDATRDGVFLINTWGDRNRDSRINEGFIGKEIEAGARLGVDVIQIDDGWQKGRTKNSSKGGGVWSGWWAADPQFWNPDPQRFPHGLGPVAQAARAQGLRLGLWYAPDSSKDAVNWQLDADRILELHRDFGVDYFKIDSLSTASSAALKNQHRLFDRVLQASDGRIVFDLDVTADIRPGYFSLPEMGPIFVENRYTDSHSYWPHSTLRNLWELSQYVDPLRLRMEFLNNTRNADRYANDPLAPGRYPPDTLFAMNMFASPLGWFEASSLPKEFVAEVAPLVAKWKRERERLQAGNIIPIAQAPDGVAWTGFASTSAHDPGGYVLLFRELNENSKFSLNLNGLLAGNLTIKNLAGRGTADLENGNLNVSIPAPLDFLWVRLDASNAADAIERPDNRNTPMSESK